MSLTPLDGCDKADAALNINQSIDRSNSSYEYLIKRAGLKVVHSVVFDVTQDRAVLLSPLIKVG